MKLEEVKKLFEKKGIFFFKIVQLRTDKWLSEDVFPAESNYVFQSHFLYILRHSVPTEEIEESCPAYLWPFEVVRNKNPECELAERNFSDLLHTETADQVSEEIKRHIADCTNCREKLKQFHNILLNPDKLNKKQSICVNKIIERLVDHFGYLGKSVDCKTVRRFLPQLADIELPILIPTPISVHVDNCWKCRQILFALCHYKLTSKELVDLSAMWSGAKPDKMRRKDQILFPEEKQSGITTIYQLGESSEKLAAAESRDLYAEMSVNYNAYLPPQWPGRKIAVGCNWSKSTVALIARRAPLEDIAAPAFAHIHKCEQCRQDIKTLQNLNLEDKQLEILARFYWRFRYLPEVAPEDTIESLASHEHAETITELFAQMRFDKLSAKTLQHICLCRKCRNKVYQKRLEMSNNAVIDPDSNFPCQAVKAASLFTYCLPFGLDPANDEYEKFRPSFVTHVTNCPRCLEKLRQFHNTLYTIADRGESGVVIYYEFDPDAADEQEVRDMAHRYDDWPITVSVSMSGKAVPKPKPVAKPGPEPEFKPEPELKPIPEPSPEPAAVGRTIKFPKKLFEKAAAVNRKKIKKAAAAAVIPIAFGLFLYLFFSTSTPVVSAKTYNLVVGAVKKLENVCILRFKAGQTEPTGKEWVSKTLNIHLFKIPGQLILRDLPNKMIKIKDLSSVLIKTLPISEEKLIVFKKELEGSLGLLPFESINDAPGNVKWDRIDDKNMETVVPGTEVYDLTWLDKNGYMYKRRVFVDPHSSLPRRIELYDRTDPKKEYTFLEYYEVIPYPADTEINSVIESIFGADAPGAASEIKSEDTIF